MLSGSNSTSNSAGTGRVSMNTYEWEIPRSYRNYAHLKMGEKVNSPIFTIHDKPWHLEMYPDGKDKDCKGYVSLYLRMLDVNKSIKARFIFTLVDCKDQIIMKIDINKMHTFKGTAFGFGRFIEKSLFVLTVENIKLKFLCQIIGENDHKSGSHVMKPSETISGFLNKEQFSDVKFIVEKKCIFAHKLVLSTQSPVFAAMFQHRKKENRDNIIEIEDTRYEIFYELLRYMYTGSIIMSDNIASDLLVAADKYRLPNLKDVCEKNLRDNLSINNALSSLALADMHNANYLKKKAIDFFASNAKEVIYTPDFEILTNFKTDLLRDLFSAILSRSKK